MSENERQQTPKRFRILSAIDAWKQFRCSGPDLNQQWLAEVAEAVEALQRQVATLEAETTSLRARVHAREVDLDE